MRIREIWIGLMLIQFNCSCQKTENKKGENNLIGKWIEVRTENERGNINDPNGIPFYSGMNLVFYKSSMHYIYTNETGKAQTYFIRQDTLIIGDTKYIIEKLSKTDLVLLNTEIQEPIGRLRGIYRKE